MKKFLLSIFFCLMAVFAVQAQETVKLSCGTGITSTSGNYVNGKIKMSTEKGSASNAPAYNANSTELRFYYHSSGNGGSATLTTDGSIEITSIVLTASSTSYTPNVKYNVDGGTDVSGTWSGTTMTISNISAKETFKFRNANTTNKQLRIKSITITYAASGEGGEEVITLEKPIISPEKTTFNDGENIEVTITAEEGATIHYTLDGNDPTKESGVYSAPISITETTTVKAIAVKEGCENSEVAEATYTAIDPNAAAFEIIAEEQGYANGDAVETLTFGDVTATLAKGSNNNAPKYYTTGKAIRAYGGNTITFTCATNVLINKIEFTFSSGEDSNEITADCGTYSDGVWNGSSNNVVFAIGGTSGHRRVAAIKVTYATQPQPSGLVATLTVGEAGYATLYLGAAVQIPEGVSAYIVTGTSNGYAMMTEVTGIIPANTGLILEAESGEYEFAFYDKGTADVTGNLLTGSLYPMNVEEEAYVLADGEDGVGLYKAEMNQMDGTAWLNNANKAYLPVNAIPASAQGAANFSFNFDWNGTTGIENIEATEENAAFKGIYDLTGRKINKIAVTGIYIIDGKKVLVVK